MIAVNGILVGGLQYTRQVNPLASSRSKMVLADHTLEAGHLSRLVQSAEQVVE
jgi:hypothetical protein